MHNVLLDKLKLAFDTTRGFFRGGFGRFDSSRFAQNLKHLLKNRALVWTGASVFSVLIVGVSILLLGTQGRDLASAATYNFGEYDFIFEGNGHEQAVVDYGRLWHVYPCYSTSPMYNGTDTFGWVNNLGNSGAGHSSCWQLIDPGYPNIDVVVHCIDPTNLNPPGKLTLDTVTIPGNATDQGGGVWTKIQDTNKPSGTQQRVEINIRVRSFKPTGKSFVAQPANSDTNQSTVTETIVAEAVSGASWISGTTVKYCSRMYGPYSTPQTSQPNDWLNDATVRSGDVCTGDSKQPAHPTSPSQFDLKFQTNGTGYYYFQVYVPTVGQPGGTSVEGGFVGTWAATCPGAESSGTSGCTEFEHTYFFKRITPAVKSETAPKHIDDTTANVYDKINISGSDWTKTKITRNKLPNGTYYTYDNPSTDLSVCVRMHGPYQSPKTGTVGWGDDLVKEVCNPMNPGWGTAAKNNINFDFGSGALYKPGYYYFTTKITKSQQSAANQEQLVGDFEDNIIYKPADDQYGDGASETIVRKFQPYFTSKVSQTFIDDINNSHKITDTITSHAAETLANANIGADNNITSYWLDTIPVKVCVKAWGPYQQAQAYGTSPLPGNPSGQTSPIATICSDNTSTGTGGSSTGGNFTGVNQDRSFSFNTSTWNPGYYYFTEHMLLSDQPTNIRNYLISDWHSKFNPEKTGDIWEDEATIEKFQIKPTSQTTTPSANTNATLSTIKTDIIGDANHNGKSEGTGEPTKNSLHNTWDRDAIPVLKPTDTYIEDSFNIQAYDTNSSDDTTTNANASYWLKDLNGNFITFYVCATVYGPYQSPQGAGNSSGSAPRIPSTGIGYSTDPKADPNFPNNYNGNKDGRTQCFWTNATTAASTATSGLIAKPSASGGPGTYTVRWDNQGTNYFLPGYYYIVWNVDATYSGTPDATHNNHETTVNIGEGNITTQKNGEFLESNWWSPFGEQTEAFYSPFQPIAKSNIPEFTNTNPADKTSNRTNSSASNSNGGIILECDENKYSNLVNYVDNPEEYPHEKLHCHNVTDQIFLGAVDDKAINDTTHEVDSTNNRDEYWPKDKDGKFEPVKFQVKLYGPFSYPYSRTPSDDNKAGWTGNNLVTTVPKSVDGKAVEAATAFAQPIAQSCVITTSNVGPNWDGSPTPYDAVFTQDIASCQGSTPSNNTIKLTPGFYVSIVEIVRDDIDNTNPAFREAACASTASLSNRAANARCATQGMTRPHNMLIEDRFTSAWGDKRESILVPIPLYIITRRDNSAQDTFIDQVTINDQYWVAGFNGEYVGDDGKKHPWTDVWGDAIPEYGTYSGEAGYVMTGSIPTNYKYEYQDTGVGDYYSSDTPNDIYVNLYGAYPLENGRPSENDEYCKANMLVKNGTWRLPPEDTPLAGKDLPYPAPLTLYEKGWYVFQYSYSGGDRITNIKTQCGDSGEMFRIVKNQIGLVTTAGSDSKIAPTRILDVVQVTGSFTESDRNSIVKLSLYKRIGTTNQPDGDDGAPLCVVIFTVSQDGTYSIADYLDKDGYPLPGQTSTGRCYAEGGGYYYWVEEFLQPGSNPLNPTPSDYIQPKGEGKPPEDIDIQPAPKPEVTTDADPTTSVNKPFHDTALVTNIPDGSTKKYYLWFTAYGPYADGRVDCNSQLIYSNQSSPITVTKNGRYDSEYITVSSNGIVYWVEHLTDEEGNIIDQGECGARRENTYVIAPTPDIPGITPFEPFQVTPSYPDAGYISQQLGKVIALGFMTMLGAWQLTNKNSWLLKKR